MRTVAGAITTAEADSALVPSHAMTAWRELLLFPAPTSTANANLETDVPQTYRLNDAGTYVYAAWRKTDGTLQAVVFAPGTAANWGLTQTAVALQTDDVGTMRAGLLSVAGTMYAYRAVASGSLVQVQRATLTGTTNPPTLGTWTDYGVTFGFELTDTATLVRRVEAVCPTTQGVIVALGAYNLDDATYPGKQATISFYWLPSTTVAVPLNAVIQSAIADTYATWYGLAQWATCVSATELSDGVLVVANARLSGRAVAFTVRTGIESPLYPVVPCDVENEAITFTPSTVTTINSLYYLCGRFTRYPTVLGVTQATGATSYDCWLTSADGWNWSIGERSHYLHSASARGSMILAGTTVYHGGNGYVTSTTATKVQGNDAPTTLTAALLGWRLSQTSNGADALTADIDNSEGAYSSHATVRNGSVVKLRSGQGADLADIGIYGIDYPTESATAAGYGIVGLEGRDLGSKTILAWHAPLDMAWRSLAAFTSLMASDTGMVRKTPECQDTGNKPHLKYGTTGLEFAGLNDPAILYLDDIDHADALTKLTGTVYITGDYHLSSIGVLIGCADDGSGNVFLIPAANAWTGYTHTTASMQRLSLNAIDPADPTALDTGFNFAPRINGLWESVLGTTGERTVAVTGTYRTSTAPALAAGTTYDIAVRTSGRRAQLFIRARDMDPADLADAALYTLCSEFFFGGVYTRMAPAGKSYGGLALATDVFVDTDAWAHAVYDDVELSLTAATNYLGGGDPYTAGVQSAYAVQIAGTYNVSNVGATNQITLITGNIAHFSAGQRIRVVMNFSAHGDRYGVVDTAVGTTITTVDDIVSGANQGSDTSSATVFLASAEEWGYASSEVRDRDISGSSVTDDPGAAKAALTLYGAGIVVSNDNTALEYSTWGSDGITHRKLGDAWDATWPGDVSTEPSAWRFIFAHNRIADYYLSTSAGLGATGHLLCDREVVAYEQASFAQFAQVIGGSPTVTSYWTRIPTRYTVVAAQAAPSSSLVNAWISGGVVGEPFDSANITVGMLVELTGRNSGVKGGFKRPEAEEVPPQYYVQAKTGSGSTAAVTLGTYDEPYGTLSATTPDTVAGANEIATCSGRGRFGTSKVGHNPTAPVVYYPCDSTGNPARITISRFARYSGLYQSMQDSIARACALAGMRGATFRNQFTTPTATITRAISTTPYTLPLREAAVDFVLDMSCHIPGCGTGSGYTNNWLSIDFRGYYRLTLKMAGTSAQYDAGYYGILDVGLQTTSTDVDAGADGYRWLERAAVPVTDHNFAGAVGGSTPNYTFTQDVAKNVDLRLIVRGGLVTVEMNRCHVWTFNLDDMNDGGDNSYRVDNGGDIVIAYLATIASNTATINVQELGGETAYWAVQKAGTARQAIDDITADRHVRDIANTTGGRVFSQFWTRDDAGALAANLLTDNWKREDNQRTGHQQVSGQASGETIDEATIRAEGYQFDAGQNETVVTVGDATAEARLTVREKKEYAGERQVTGYGRIALQPEDLVDMSYTGATGLPTHTETAHVVTVVDLEADDAAVMGTYTIRDYVSSV